MKVEIQSAMALVQFVLDEARCKHEALREALAQEERAAAERRHADVLRLLPRIRVVLTAGPIYTKRILAETIRARMSDTAAALDIMVKRESVRRTANGYELVA